MRYCPACKNCFEDEAGICRDDGSETISIVPGSCLLDGKYRVVRLLGRGGMGAVFEAVQLGIERRAAVKLINPAYVADPLSRERFRREAMASGRVKHPNAITVYDYGVTADGVAYLAMEFLSGISLRDELHRSREMSPERVAALFEPICAAVEAAHRQGLVHRDLKPDNIFLETLDDGTIAPKVLDFGIAKLRTEASDATALTGLGPIGTPAYMSPEQASGRELDARSDIYSLAVIAFEALSGRLPFESNSSMGYAILHATAPPTYLSAANPNVPPAVESVVMRALEKAPDARPQSAMDFARALSQSVSTSRSSAPIAPSPLSSAPAAPAGVNVAFAYMKRLAAQAVGPSAGDARTGPRVLGWPVGVAPGAAPEAAAVAFGEIGREVASAAVQKIPWDVIFEAAGRWAERRLGSSGLLPPQSAARLSGGVATGSAGLALFCPTPGVSWSIRMEDGTERPLLLGAEGNASTVAQTIPDVAAYWVSGLDGGRLAALVARLGGIQVWSDGVALVDGGTSLVLCLPESQAGGQGPESLTHLFGTVELVVDAPGAGIFVDDGPAPWGTIGTSGRALLYCVVPGPHRVSVRREFFVPAVAEIAVAAGERTTVELALQHVEVDLTVASSVEGVRVELIGPEPSETSTVVELKAASSAETLRIPAGSYAVRAAREGYVDVDLRRTLASEAGERLDLTLVPVSCPVCGKGASEGTFSCSACRREHIHEAHRHSSGVCSPCAASAAFGKARTAATIEAWEAFLSEFESVDAELAKQASSERRRLVDDARSAEITERAERFASLAGSGRLSETIASWRSISEAEPTNPEPQFALGMALEASGDRNAAVAAYRAAVERGPSDPFLRRAFARCLVDMRLFDDAMREYTAVIGIKPDFAEAHFEFANVFLTLGHVDAAIEGFRTAAHLRPEIGAFHDALGRAFATRGRHREAGDALSQAARCYRAEAAVERAADADQRAQAEYDKTALRKAGKFIKNLFDRE